MRKFVYSIAMPLNRGGMATIAWHATCAMQKSGLLQCAAAPEVGAAGSLQPYAREMPFPLRKGMAVLNRLRLHSIHDRLFDHWAANWIGSDTNFYGWLHQSLACIRAVHRNGGLAFVDRGSVEPCKQQHWLTEEYVRFGLQSAPIPSQTVQRMQAEGIEADGIFVPSRLVAESYIEAGFPFKKIFINPLGVDASRYTPRSATPAEHPLRFVFVGQLSIQKGLPDLLAAWHKIQPCNAELTLAGIIPPDEESVIRPLLNQTHRIQWKGHCTDVPALLRECDVLILPSAQDGFGLVVLEALACGLPVIVSDRVGAKDCVRDKINGRIFEFGFHDHLIENLRWFLDTPDRSSQMREAALNTAKEYSWEAYGQRLVGILADRH